MEGLWRLNGPQNPGPARKTTICCIVPDSPSPPPQNWLSEQALSTRAAPSNPLTKTHDPNMPNMGPGPPVLGRPLLRVMETPRGPKNPRLGGQLSVSPKLTATLMKVQGGWCQPTVHSCLNQYRLKPPFKRLPLKQLPLERGLRNLACPTFLAFVFFGPLSCPVLCILCLSSLVARDVVVHFAVCCHEGHPKPLLLPKSF